MPLSAPDLIDLCDQISMGIVFHEAKAFWDAFLEDRGQGLSAFIDRTASRDVVGVFQMIADDAAPDRRPTGKWLGRSAGRSRRGSWTY